MSVPKKLIYRGKAKFMKGKKEAEVLSEHRFGGPNGTLFGYVLQTPSGTMILAKSFPDANKTWGYA